MGQLKIPPKPAEVCCEKTCSLFNCSVGYVANELYIHNTSGTMDTIAADMKRFLLFSLVLCFAVERRFHRHAVLRQSVPDPEGLVCSRRSGPTALTPCMISRMSFACLLLPVIHGHVGAVKGPALVKVELRSLRALSSAMRVKQSAIP